MTLSKTPMHKASFGPTPLVFALTCAVALGTWTAACGTETNVLNLDPRGRGTGAEPAVGSGGGTGTGGLACAEDPTCECENDADCPEEAPGCDQTRRVCIACVIDAHCEEGKVCGGGECHTPCASDEDCGGELCSTATHLCVECIASSDCQDVEKPYCLVDSGSCVECLANGDCTSDSEPACLEHQCEECSSDDQCAAGTTCDVSEGSCI